MSFIDFGMMVDLENAYYDYVDKCEKENIEPVDFKTWWETEE